MSTTPLVNPIADDQPLVLLHDGDVRRVLLDFKGRAFHYHLNTAGQQLLLAGAGVLIASCVAILLVTKLAVLWSILAAIAGVIGVATLAYIWRWRKFSQTSFVALDQDFLYIGDNKRAWRVAWGLLDAQSMGFDKLEIGKGNGKLELNVAGQKIDLQLYHPLTHVEDLQGFMFEVLTRFQDPEALTSEEE